MNPLAYALITERAKQDGWRLDEPCECIEPRPVAVGGNGYVIPPWMCCLCRCATRVRQSEEEDAWCELF